MTLTKTSKLAGGAEPSIVNFHNTQNQDSLRAFRRLFSFAPV